MRATRDDDEALTLDVHNEILVVDDHGVGDPLIAGQGVVRRKPLLKFGHPLDLAGDQDRVVDEKAGPRLLDDLQALVLQVTLAGGRHVDLVSGRKHYLSLPPRLRVDDEGKLASTVSREESLEPAVMIAVAVRDRDGSELLWIDAHDIEVLGKAVA